MKLLLTLLLLCLSSFAATVTIDSGSSTDLYFSGGSTWQVPGGSSLPDYTLRFGPVFSYRIPASGDSSVTLRFLEPNQSTPGARVFSVAINGQVVIGNLDLVSIAGFLTPYAQTFQATARNGFLDIVFTASVRSAVVSSIEVISAPVPPSGPIAVGVGLISTLVGDKQTLLIDTANVLHLGQDAGLPLPAAGDGCNVSGAVIVAPDAVYFCAAILPLSTAPNPWGRWLRIAASRPVDGEAPRGVIDGMNAVYGLMAAPSPASLHLFRNGVRQKEGVDYALSGAVITFVAAGIPQPGDTLLGDYRQ